MESNYNSFCRRYRISSLNIKRGVRKSCILSLSNVYLQKWSETHFSKTRRSNSEQRIYKKLRYAILLDNNTENFKDAFIETTVYEIIYIRKLYLTVKVPCLVLAIYWESHDELYKLELPLERLTNFYIAETSNCRCPVWV